MLAFMALLLIHLTCTFFFLLERRWLGISQLLVIFWLNICRYCVCYINLSYLDLLEALVAGIW